MQLLRRFMEDAGGVTSIEYALIIAATGLTLIAVMPAIGTGLVTKFGEVSVGLK
ncbi:MAG: Flp family type IVb pilin [Hyphomicrobiales bacterium]